MKTKEYRGKFTGLLVATTAFSLSFGGWALADNHSGYSAKTTTHSIVERAAKAALEAAEERREADWALKVGDPEAAEEVAEAEAAEKKAARLAEQAKTAQAQSQQACRDRCKSAPQAL